MDPLFSSSVDRTPPLTNFVLHPPNNQTNLHSRHSTKNCFAKKERYTTKIWQHKYTYHNLSASWATCTRKWGEKTMELYRYKRGHGGFTLLYTLTKMSPTKWGAEINKYLSNNAQPFLPFFNLYPLLDWDKEETGEGNNSYTKFSAIHDWHCPETPIIHHQQAAARRSVQLVQVKSKNSPHSRVAMRPVDDNISAVSRV